jgi:hypothetical protein
MLVINVKENDSLEKALKKFKKNWTYITQLLRFNILGLGLRGNCLLIVRFM